MMMMMLMIKLTELWNTSLLFDLNPKFELMGASLLALAKFIYYESPMAQRLDRTSRAQLF